MTMRDLRDMLGSVPYTPPTCPTHGTDAMQEMTSVGAPGWFTCTAPAFAPGGVCGHAGWGTAQ